MATAAPGSPASPPSVLLVRSFGSAASPLDVSAPASPGSPSAFILTRASVERPAMAASAVAGDADDDAGPPHVGAAAADADADLLPLRPSSDGLGVGSRQDRHAASQPSWSIATARLASSEDSCSDAGHRHTANVAGRDDRGGMADDQSVHAVLHTAVTDAGAAVLVKAPNSAMHRRVASVAVTVTSLLVALLFVFGSSHLSWHLGVLQNLGADAQVVSAKLLIALCTFLISMLISIAWVAWPRGSAAPATDDVDSLVVH